MQLLEEQKPTAVVATMTLLAARCTPTRRRVVDTELHLQKPLTLVEVEVEVEKRHPLVRLPLEASYPSALAKRTATMRTTWKTTTTQVVDACASVSRARTPASPAARCSGPRGYHGHVAAPHCARPSPLTAAALRCDERRGASPPAPAATRTCPPASAASSFLRLPPTPSLEERQRPLAPH